LFEGGDAGIAVEGHGEPENGEKCLG
jgi:hypothetical protein